MTPVDGFEGNEKLSLSLVKKSNIFSSKEGSVLLSTNATVGFVDDVPPFLGLENPGSSDCSTGCFGNNGRKNLLSVAPMVQAFELAVALDDLLCKVDAFDVIVAGIDLPPDWVLLLMEIVVVSSSCSGTGVNG